MNFERSLIFSYLEEDNIQRAFFRVRPLLTLDGDVQQEAVKLWPNDGALRIVPDRNEQHTFKGRMRTLGSYCVVDLRNQPAEAGKIRTNKNFKPDRGEVNQYILYSDTVHELPCHTFYQMLEGSAADYASLCDQAVTPLFYIRSEDTVYGPVCKGEPALPAPAKEAAGTLFEITFPDGIVRTMLCIDECPLPEKADPHQQETTLPKPSDEAAAEPCHNEPVQDTTAPEEAKPEDASLPIGKTLKILDEAQTHEDTLKKLDQPVSDQSNFLHQQTNPIFAASTAPAKTGPLTGTPLIATPVRVSVPQIKNRTQEVVNSQWNVGKYEPPASNLPAGTAMRTVNNPVETAGSALKHAWASTASRDQLIDLILSLDGIRTKLEARLTEGNHTTILQRVLRDRLQDLEAERLTALCELDKAVKDVDAYKQDLIKAIAGRLKQETRVLEENKSQAQKAVDSLKSEINHLTVQRDAIQAKVAELQSDVLPEAFARILAEMQMLPPAAGVPLRITPRSGVSVDIEVLINVLCNTCSASGIAADRNAAIAILVLLAVSSRIGLSCSTIAPAATLIRNIVGALGWTSSHAHQYSPEQHPLVGARPVDTTPAILTTSLANYAPVPGLTKLTLNRSTANLVRNAAYDVNQWPIIQLPPLSFVPEMDMTDSTIVSAAAVQALAQKQSAAEDQLDAVMAPVLKAAAPLSGPARKEMHHFISVCAGLMDGGLPVAIDWGIKFWLVPAVERGSRQFAALKAALDEYPLSLAKMQ